MCRIRRGSATSLLPLFVEILRRHVAPGARILDPFAGTGRIHDLHPEWDTVGVELEPDWAALHPRTRQGSALDLPTGLGTFAAVVTSPCYGNRMADSHNAADPERRRSYTHDLGRTLHPDNTGTLHWRNGGKGSLGYRDFHEQAWGQVVTVLDPGGVLVLNIKDHYRDGLLQPVSAWHTAVLGSLGLNYIDSQSVTTPRLRAGANRELRAPELVFVFGKGSGSG